MGCVATKNATPSTIILMTTFEYNIKQTWLIDKRQ